MSPIIETLRRLYRALVPTSVRESPVVKRLKARVLGHDWIYNSDYYKSDIEGPAVQSATHIAISIVKDLKTY